MHAYAHGKGSGSMNLQKYTQKSLQAVQSAKNIAQENFCVCHKRTTFHKIVP